jgi:hypothetical protein
MQDTDDNTTAGASPTPIELSDYETFCTPCQRALQINKAYTALRLHGSLLNVVRSSAWCKFCRFMCASFGEKLVDKLLSEHESNTLPEVVFGTMELVIGEVNAGDGSGEKEMHVQRAEVTFDLGEDYKKRVERRTFWAFSNSSKCAGVW